MVLTLAEAAGVEPAHAMRGDLANRCHTIRRRLHRLAEGTGLEPASDKCAVVFKTTALPVRLPFQKQNDLWSSFLNFETFRTQMGEPSTRIKVLRSKYKVLPLGACDRTRTYEVVGRLISKEGAFAAQPHMRNEISNFKFEDSKRFQI